MKVLMFGWEFPPFISGGLGTACHGLTRGMSQLGTEVLFVLPRPVESTSTQHVRLLSPGQPVGRPEPGAPTTSGRAQASEPGIETAGPEHLTLLSVDVALRPYGQPVDPVAGTLGPVELERVLSGQPIGTDPSPDSGVDGPAAAPAADQDVQHSPAPTPPPSQSDYGGDIFAEVSRYTAFAARIAATHTCDVVHAHDWMTYGPGMAAARVSGKPLVVHVHSTEFDRSGEHVNQRIYDIERAGMHAADRVITVSYLTKRIVTRRYGVDPSKVIVVYNAIDYNGKPPAPISKIRSDEKIVLFLGRITMQKGPEYFVRAAKRVLEVMKDVRFIMAGSGDLARRSIELAAELGIGHKVLFTGFLRGGDVERVFRMADLYVMPSVSEPFGIAPLEAICQDVPVLISKQSGVSELITHALKVDFWDVDEMANKIVAVLRHPPLHATLRRHSSFEVRQLSWVESARCCLDAYGQAIAAANGPAR